MNRLITLFDSNKMQCIIAFSDEIFKIQESILNNTLETWRGLVEF